MHDAAAQMTKYAVMGKGGRIRGTRRKVHARFVITKTQAVKATEDVRTRSPPDVTLTLLPLSRM